MAASDLTSVAYIYKRYYSDKQVGDLAMRDHPLFKMMSKEGGFSGTAYFYAIRYGNPQGVGGTFASTQAAAASSKGVQLQASRKPKYGVITMDGEAMAAAEGDKGAFLDLVTQETDGVLEEMGDSLAFDLYREGYGQRGRISAISSDLVTLTVADHARNFKVGMTVVGDDTAAGTSLRDSGDSTTVTAVDEDQGKISLASVAAISGLTTNDYLFRVGDPGTCMEGLMSHFPLTAPVLGSDSFRGIDRGQHARALSGVRVNDTATAIEENSGLVAVKINQSGQKAKVVMLNPINFWQVARRLNAKVTYDGGGNKAAYGFEGFDIHTPAGTLRCISDPDCPTTLGFVLNTETLYLKHLRGLPHIIKDDDRPSLRQTSADGVEARARGWVNLICTKPGANGTFAI